MVLEVWAFEMQIGFIKLDNLITEILHFPLNFQNQKIKFPNNQVLDDKRIQY